MFQPARYYKGLSREEKKERKKEFLKREGTSNYEPLKTDIKAQAKGQVKSSGYTQKFHRLFPDVHTKKDIQNLSGISVKILDEVYDRGLKAWQTGHRPGASQHAWAWARVYSFLLKGCTYYGPDSDLVRISKTSSEKAKEFWSKRRCMCHKGCPHSES